jgi:hypothetical protein
MLWIAHNFIRKHFTTKQGACRRFGYFERGAFLGANVENSKTAHL